MLFQGSGYGQKDPDPNRQSFPQSAKFALRWSLKKLMLCGSLRKNTRWRVVAVRSMLCDHWHIATVRARYANELEAGL
jgi:hypothetical protein